MSITISGNGVITGATTSYSFDQSVSIGGTLTYEDVTNIDSVGVITARSGIDVGPTSGIGITLTSAGAITAAGSATFADNIQSGGNPVSGTATGAQLNSSGGVWVSNVSGTQSVFRGYTTGNSTETARINANGLVSLGDASNATGNNGLYLGGQNGSLNIYTDRYSTDCFQILNTSGSGTNVALKVYGKGDVEIAGIIQSNTKSAGNIELDSTGAFSSPKIKLFASTGDATFTGNLTANAKVLGTGTSGTGKVVGYQQGTWTPVYAEAGNLNNEATNYSNRLGYWWRVGNIVTVSATLNMASSAGISINNTLVLKDFPYVCQNVPAYYGSSSTVHANGWAANTTVFVNILIPANTTKADLYYATSSQSGNYGAVDYTKIGTGSLIFNMSYLTDDATWTPANGATVAS